jgi:hypothetical protein
VDAPDAYQGAIDGIGAIRLDKAEKMLDSQYEWVYYT